MQSKPMRRSWGDADVMEMTVELGVLDEGFWIGSG